MYKKILLLTIFLFALVFIPITRVNATQVYVGVQITSASAPGCNLSNSSYCSTTSPVATDSNWCLPIGTTLSIYDSTSTNLIPAVLPTTNPTTITSPICTGGTIWSGLFDSSNLSMGTNTTYNAKVYAGSFCPGYYLYNSYCWVALNSTSDCDSTCRHFGLTANDVNSSVCSNSFFADCTVIKSLTGASCPTLPSAAGCTSNCCLSQNGNSGYNYYDAASGNCYYTNSYGSVTNCDAGNSIASSGSVRACYCNVPYGQPNFTFAFQP